MILDRIVRAKRQETVERKALLPPSEIERQVETAPPTRDFASALARQGTQPVRLIAEFKRASPSKGPIRNDLSPAEVARRYEKAGAAAMSVLTDEPFFSGSLEDLQEARAAVDLPLLRKDFILDPYQLLEARAAGADAVLLIVAALSDKALTTLHVQAATFGLAAVVEIHDQAELRRALAAGSGIIGINNRDLRSFRVDLETTFKLRLMIPRGITVVSESGIGSREDVLRLQEAGVDAILVGEFLMRQPDPGEAARRLLGNA